MNMIIDTHAHLKSEDDIKEINDFIKDNIVILAGTNLIDNKVNLKLCHQYKNIYTTVGIHPLDIEKDVEEGLSYIEQNINNDKVVGIGEIGLDLYWNKENLDEQLFVFDKQIKIAKKYNKAILIHTRDSLKEVYNLLLKNDIGQLPIILHCYSGDLELADKFIENFNVKFGIGGVITYKNANSLREFVLKTDLKYIVLETDTPYLTPEPNRGKKNNPSNVSVVAAKIAEIKGITEKEVIEITTNNAICQFDLKI
jgi:TatD DNase family protein